MQINSVLSQLAINILGSRQRSQCNTNKKRQDPHNALKSNLLFIWWFVRWQQNQELFIARTRRLFHRNSRPQCVVHRAITHHHPRDFTWEAPSTSKLPRLDWIAIEIPYFFDWNRINQWFTKLIFRDNKSKRTKLPFARECYDLPMIWRLDTVYILYHVYNWNLPF